MKFVRICCLMLLLTSVVAGTAEFSEASPACSDLIETIRQVNYRNLGLQYLLAYYTEIGSCSMPDGEAYCFECETDLIRTQLLVMKPFFGNTLSWTETACPCPTQ
ncbi:hypothetical protein [Desulfomonile tiedjei]|nr:hypothetical protein [Desulfomonile tiedjei]